ncbi:restriction endonuclease subunit S [Acinetobacter bereziniae]|uniref:restriction endonuclease subunit S n=1 Tax=Acinetobacter bereziniae TaxID=106648 RepID=UPI00257724AB|nr:restriction endonuclease subunit S [Acinetobacter bereziniae]MDM1786763.1 restriction endonuclease subunit S [Acinetobacter bereziniae]
MSYPLIPLGQLAKFINGDRGKNYPSKDSFVDIGIPFINAGCLSDLWVLDSSKFNYISEEAYDRLSSGKIQKNDILFCLRGSVGKFAVIRDNNKGALASSLVILRGNDKVDIEYLKHYLASSLCIKELDNYQNGAAQPNLSANDFKKFLVPLPPLAEQRRIASILDQADVLRQKRQQAIEKLDQLLQATFIDMFGDPVSNPKGWEVKKLSELSTKIHSGNTPKGGSENYVDQGIIFLRSQNVWKNKVILDDVAYIDAETHSKMMKSSVKHEDLLMTKTGRINTENSSLGRAAIYLGEDDSANINGHVYLIRIKDGFNKYFILRILTLPDYYEYIRSVCVGGIDKRQLNKEHIENFPIIQPPMELQNKFSNIVQVIESQKPKLLEQLDLAENLFKTLQQKAFNGTL